MEGKLKVKIVKIITLYLSSFIVLNTLLLAGLQIVSMCRKG